MTTASVRAKCALLILPVMLGTVSLLMLSGQGPYYLGNYFEDDYSAHSDRLGAPSTPSYGAEARD